MVDYFLDSISLLNFLIHIIFFYFMNYLYFSVFVEFLEVGF